MKLKGKALLSLLLVLTLVTQLFTVSAAATGGESLVYALYLDEAGQSTPIYDGDEFQNCTVTVGEWTTLATTPTGVSLSQLMSDTLKVAPPEGFSVERLWLYGSDSSNPVALPLTAADPSQGGNLRTVSVKPEALIGGNDNGSPLFNEQLLSSWTADGTYTLGILLKRVEGDVVITNEYTGSTEYTATTTPGFPGDQGSSAFVGWRLRYDNGASVLVNSDTYIQPYASCTLSAAYAPIITLTPRSVTVPEGTSRAEVESAAVVDAANLPDDLTLSYASAYVADAGDILSPGSYSLRVGSYTIVDRNTGRELNDSTRASVRCEDGVVTVEPGQVIGEWVEPDNQNEQPAGGSVDIQPSNITPNVTTVNVTVSDQGWSYTGTPDVVGMNCLSLDPWVEGANFAFYYTDAWGNTSESAVNAGEYTLTAVYTGGLDESLYSVNVLNSAKLTIYPIDLRVTAASDSKTYDGSALVNTEYSAEGLLGGHSVSDVQFSLTDLYGSPMSEWPVAVGTYTKSISSVRVTDANGSDVGANYNIILTDGTLTITEAQRTTVTASIPDQTLSYTGAPQTLDPSLVQLEPVVGGAGFTISYVDANGAEWESVTNAGTYSLRLSYTGGLGDGYDVVSGSVGTLTVAPATLRVTAASDSKTADGSALVNTEYSAEGLLSGHRISDIQFSLADASGNWLTEWPSAAGTYTKTVSGLHVLDANDNDVGANYNIITADGTLTITEAQRTTVTASLADQTLSYTGAAQTVDTALVQLDPAVSGASFTISYVDANGQTLESVTDPGSYTMQLAYAGGLDENAYTVVIGSVGTLTVAAPQRTTVTASLADQTLSYTGAAQTVDTALVQLDPAVSGASFTISYVDANGQPLESVTNPGSYTMQLAYAGGLGENAYTVVIGSVGTLTVAAPQRTTVTVTVPERSFVYDGTAHSFDASILTVEPVVEGIQISVSILDANGQTLESVTDVGSYTLQASVTGGVDTNLYDVQVAGTAPLTVTARELTVTAASASKTYDGTALQNTEYTASGLVEGHRLRESEPVDFAVKDANGNPVEGWPVQQGTYTKTATAAHVLDSEGHDVSANYSLKAVDGTLTITAPEVVNVTVTVSNQTFVYDGQPHTPKADEYTVQGLKDNDTLTVTLSAAQTNGSELASVTEVGSYTIKAAVSGYDTNKYNVTVQAGTLTVTPYEVTVTAESASKNFDNQPLENRGYSVEPALLSGHRIDSVQMQILAQNGTATQGFPSAQGVYTKRIVSLKILDAANNDVTKNYSLKYVNGTLTINAGVPTERRFLDDSGNTRGTAYNYNKKSTEGLRFRIEADPQLLSRVLVDNTVVASQYYTVQNGSTIVILQPTYLDTLTSQQHVLRVEFNDNGFATTTFTVADASPTVSSVKFYGKNDSKNYDGNAYDLTTAYKNRFYSNASIQSISFHLGQGGMSVSQAVNPGTYDIYLDSLVLNKSTPEQQFNITVIDANGNTVATNYQNTSVKVGTLTITQTTKTNVRVTVQDQTWSYDGTAHTLNPNAYTVEGLQGSDTVTVKLSIVDKNGRTLSAVTDAGTYNIKADVTGYDAGRYTVTTTGVGTLNVNPYKLTLTAVSASKNYDGRVLRNTDVKATALVSGHKFRSGDGVKFSVYDSKGNLIQNGPVDVGTYTKKVTEVHIVDANNIEVTANYDITRVDGTLTVVKGSGSPKTGDQNHIGLWIALLAASAVLVIVVAIYLLRRNARPKRRGAHGQSAKRGTQTVSRSPQKPQKPEKPEDDDFTIDFDFDEKK